MMAREGDLLRAIRGGVCRLRSAEGDAAQQEEGGEPYTAVWYGM